MPGCPLSYEESLRFLTQAFYGRLGTSRQNVPYIVPVLFAYKDGRIFIHSKPTGRKIRNLTENPRVCFEVSEPQGLRVAHRACDWGLSYRSVITTGLARVVKERVARQQAITHLVEKYAGEQSSAVILDEELDKVVVIEIDIDQITGKRNQLSD